MNIKEIRRRALSELSRCWVESVFIFLTLLSLWGLTLSAYALIINDYISEYDFYAFLDVLGNMRAFVSAILLYVISYIASTPLFYGIKWCFLQQAGGNAVPMSCIFSCYSSSSRWVRAVKLRLAVDLRQLIVLVPLICVFAAEFEVFTHFDIEGEAMHIFMVMLIIISLVVLSAIFLRASNRYALVPYMFAADPDMSVKEMLRKGIDYSTANKDLIYKLKLSFVLYSLLCIAAFPIFFVYPYISMSMAVAADMIINNKEETASVHHRRRVKRNEAPAAVSGGVNV